MKTTKLYMAIFFHDTGNFKLENALISYMYIPKDSDETNKFHKAILERRELRKQAKEERQNQGTK